MTGRTSADPWAQALLGGVDFTSAPRARKPITLAWGRLQGQTLQSRDARQSGHSVWVMEGIEMAETWGTFEGWLQRPGPWVVAFDFPFGLPRAFIEAQGWLGTGTAWSDVTRELARLERRELVARCRAFCAPRPPGAKFAHRATDQPAGSSPSMKWVNPPVVLMLQEGAPRLLASGVDLPALHPGDPGRVALEGYPALIARELVGRASYKSDDPRLREDAARRELRSRMVAGLESGLDRLGLRAELGVWRSTLVDDPSADRLDAVLCAVQAAWAWQQRFRRFGLPEAVDPLEGWIVGA